MHNLVLSPIDPEKLISSIADRVTANIITAFANNNQPIETERWFDLKELCEYHPDKPKESTVYGWVNAGIIPVHKGKKKLRFLKSEVDAWLKQGRKKTLAETDCEAEQYLTKNKKG